VAALPRDEVPLIIFVTAYDRYALRAFEISVCDYLLKPFDEDRLATAVERVLQRYDQSGRGFGAALDSLLKQVHQPKSSSQVVVKVDGRHLFLDSDEIDWVQADGKELRIHLGKNIVAVRESLSSLEHRLPPGRFLRVHRSTVVNRSRIRELQPWFQGEYVLILRDGARVITGPRYREAVQQLTRGRRSPHVSPETDGE
jgi:two-component system LytT family response regulator